MTIHIASVMEASVTVPIDCHQPRVQEVLFLTGQHLHDWHVTRVFHLNTCHLTLFHMKDHSVVKTGVDTRNQISYMCLTRV